ncbi:hypothetical protein SASPL_151371 [Salvia splendens]|uniref:Uncharacterized protein n=1 Tax=Salvia splendens TaxID=180675 RepID=A0A8X8W993_SALSN|nr:hypothetical protein SASPL_151371 [Salvia splendens]
MAAPPPVKPFKAAVNPSDPLGFLEKVFEFVARETDPLKRNSYVNALTKMIEKKLEVKEREGNVSEGKDEIMVENKQAETKPEEEANVSREEQDSKKPPPPVFTDAALMRSSVKKLMDEDEGEEEAEEEGEDEAEEEAEDEDEEVEEEEEEAEEVEEEKEEAEEEGEGGDEGHSASDEDESDVTEITKTFEDGNVEFTMEEARWLVGDDIESTFVISSESTGTTYEVQLALWSSFRHGNNRTPVFNFNGPE